MRIYQDLNCIKESVICQTSNGFNGKTATIKSKRKDKHD